MMRPTFSGAKNSGAGSVAAMTLTKSSIASWLPCIAPNSACISAGGGSSVANSQVNPYFGIASPSRARCQAAIASSSPSAEATASALGDDDAMAAWHRARDGDAMPKYGFTCEFATLEPPPAEMQALFGAMQGNQDAMDDFVSVMAATLPAPEFFAPENVGRIMAAA